MARLEFEIDPRSIAGDAEVTRRLIEGIGDQAIASQGGITALQQRIELVTRAAVRNFRSAATSADVFSQSLNQQQTAYERVRASVDPAFAALQRYQRAVQEVRDAQFQSIITQDEANETIARLQRQYDQASQSVDRFGDQSVQSLRRATTGLNQAERSAESFARAADVSRSFARIEASVDPALGALRQFEAAQEQVNRAVDEGVISQQRANVVLNQLETQYRRNVQNIQQFGLAQQATSRRSRQFRAQVQGTSFQVQDLAVQLAAGTSAAVAFGQQLPQLLSQFGALGAVIGTVLAIAIPLAALFFDFELGSQNLTEQLNNLSAATNTYVSAAEGTAAIFTTQIRGYTDLAAAANEALLAQERLARSRLQSQLNSVTESISVNLRSLVTEVTRVETERARVLGEISRLQQSVGNDGSRLTREQVLEYTELNTQANQLNSRAAAFNRLLEEQAAEIGLNVEQVRALGVNFDELQQAGTFEEIAVAGGRLLASLRLSTDQTGQLSDEQNDLLTRVEAVVNAAVQAAAAAEGIDLSPAVSQATTLADELLRAADNALTVSANQLRTGQQSLERAQIRTQFENDPVGAAGALAGQRFDINTADIAGATPQIIQFLEDRRAQVVANAEAEALLTQGLRDRRRASNGAARALDQQRRALAAFRDLLGELGGEQGLQQLGGIQLANGTNFDPEQVDPRDEQFIEDLEELRQQQQQRLEIIREALEARVVSEREAAEARLEIARDTEEQIQEIERARLQTSLTDASSTFGSLADITRTFAGEQSTTYRRLFAISKAFAIAEAAINIQQAISEALTLPFPANLGAIATVAAQGAAIASNIQSIAATGFQTGGFTGNGGRSEVAGVVHGQEFVANAAATRRFRRDLEMMNAGVDPAERRAAPTVGTASMPNIVIQNLGTPQTMTVDSVSRDEIRLIARDEASNAVESNAPSVIGRAIQDPNSPVSSSLAQSTATPRRFTL